MTLEEFNILSLEHKWKHISDVISYIQSTDEMYQIRRRLNPHHPEKDAQEEQYKLRIGQYERWTHIKDLYAANRDELSNTLDNPTYETCKSVMERIFTTELDEALRNVIDE